VLFFSDQKQDGRGRPSLNRSKQCAHCANSQAQDAHVVRDRACRAKKNGAPALEAYPLDAKLTPSSSWTGYASTFLRAGFKVTARHFPPQPVLRLQPRKQSS
jgi:hypothetical protein